ncbi:DMT family transporter [Candidatus Marsarchaeota archaeon]|jgi:drug/metabolite transporter (DMT)-like permease|nr:DMT family transporter [Candidatus Marsarchaeota archaeon]
MVFWYYLVIISSIIMGASTIIEKYALKNEHATSFSASFSIVIAAFSLIFLPFAKFNINVYGLLIIYLMSLLSTFSYLFNARIYKHGNISVSTPVLSSLPQFFVVLLAFVFLDEKLTILQYFAIAILLIATYFLIAPKSIKRYKQFDSKKYVYLLILNTLLMAIGGILMKYILNTGVNLYAMFILLEVFIAINMTVMISIRYNGIKEEFSNLVKNRKIIFSIAILSLLYRIFYYASLQFAYVSLASPLRNSISVIITIVIGGLVFHEHNLKRKLAITAIMLLMVYLIIT